MGGGGGCVTKFWVGGKGWAGDRIRVCLFQTLLGRKPRRISASVGFGAVDVSQPEPKLVFSPKSVAVPCKSLRVWWKHVEAVDAVQILCPEPLASGVARLKPLSIGLLLAVFPFSDVYSVLRTSLGAFHAKRTQLMSLQRTKCTRETNYIVRKKPERRRMDWLIESSRAPLRQYYPSPVRCLIECVRHSWLTCPVAPSFRGPSRKAAPKPIHTQKRGRNNYE